MIFFVRLRKAGIDIQKYNIIDSDNNIYLTVDSFIDTNNKITSSNNITRRKVNVKPYGYDKM